MKLSDQVITFNQAKRLKDLGISQASLFSWFGNETTRLMDNGKDPATIAPWIFISTTEPINNQEDDWRFDTCTTKPIAAAFTVAELGIVLKKFNVPFYWPIWDEFCFKEGSQPRGYGTEAQARAAMLIYLLETDVLTAEEVNKRLSV